MKISRSIELENSMKRIVIYQQGTSIVELLDDNDEAIDEYCQEISNVFNATNVVMLKTSHSTFIGRPSQLAGIVVEDSESQKLDESVMQQQEQEESEPESMPGPEEEVDKKIEEDIITDID